MKIKMIKTKNKAVITVALISILFFFPNPEENFIFYIFLLLITIFSIKLMWRKKK